MTVSARILERMEALGLTQSELARRVSLSQPTIAGLLSGKARSSSHLHRIARELETTPAYLTGEIDDPDAGAPPPPRPPQHQFVTMQVALPTEPVLAEMLRAVLSVSRRLDEDALALELARRLPRLLALGRFVAGQDGDGDESSEAPRTVEAGFQKASRT